MTTHKITLAFYTNESDVLAGLNRLIATPAHSPLLDFASLVREALYEADCGPQLQGHFQYVSCEEVTLPSIYRYTVTADVDASLAGVPARIVSTDNEMFTLKFNEGSALEVHFTQVRKRTVMLEA